MNTRALPLLLSALLAACAPALPPPAVPIDPAPPAPPPTPPEPPPPAPVVAPPAPPAPPPPPPPAPDVEPPDADAKLRLAPPRAEVALGGQVEVRIENADDHAYRYLHPGGSSGCDAFSWEVTLTDARGRLLSREQRGRIRLCTLAIVPPRWIVIEAGGAETVRIDTGATWYASSPGLGAAPPRELTPGTYTVTVHTPKGPLRTRLVILPRR